MAGIIEVRQQKNVLKFQLAASPSGFFSQLGGNPYEVTSHDNWNFPAGGDRDVGDGRQSKSGVGWRLELQTIAVLYQQRTMQSG